MITKTHIQKGIEVGAVSFIIDPNMESGTVCKIGDMWFYFGGLPAESENPDDYLKHIPMDNIVQQIINILSCFKESDPDEYSYYESVLEEAGCMTADTQKKECFIVIHSNYANGTDAYAFWNEVDARKSVEDDIKTTLSNLREQGYKRVELLERMDEYEIYVPDRDIYYEWSIEESTIE